MEESTSWWEPEIESEQGWRGVQNSVRSIFDLHIAYAASREKAGASLTDYVLEVRPILSKHGWALRFLS